MSYETAADRDAREAKEARAAEKAKAERAAARAEAKAAAEVPELTQAEQDEAVRVKAKAVAESKRTGIPITE